MNLCLILKDQCFFGIGLHHFFQADKGFFGLFVCGFVPSAFEGMPGTMNRQLRNTSAEDVVKRKLSNSSHCFSVSFIP